MFSFVVALTDAGKPQLWLVWIIESRSTGLAGQRLRLVQSAWRTLQGFEAVHMIRKGRVRWLAKNDAVVQALIAELFGIAA